MKSPGQSAYEAMIGWWPDDYRLRILSWEDPSSDGRERWELAARAAIAAQPTRNLGGRRVPIQGSGYSPAELLMSDEGES